MLFLAYRELDMGNIVNFESYIETTDVASRIKPYDNIDGVLIAINGAIQEEIGAKLTYHIITESIKKSSFSDTPVAKKIIEKLEEITRDEINHHAILQNILSEEDKEFLKNFKDDTDNE
jgi:rubrerythrin